MLLQSELEILQRERKLPGLSYALDPGRLLHVIQENFPHLECTSVEIHYMRYKPKTNCIASCNFVIAGGRTSGYLKILPPDSMAKFSKLFAHASSNAFVIPQHGLTISLFPFDMKLRSLSMFQSNQTAGKTLKRLLPSVTNHENLEWIPLRYKPERRCVMAAVVDDEPAGIVRFYSASNFMQALSNSAAFRSGDTLRVPKRLGKTRRHCAVGLEWIAGTPFNKTLPNSEHAKKVGRALAEFHFQKPKEIIGSIHGQEIEWLAANAATLKLLCPELRSTVERLQTRIAERLQTSQESSCAIHGDFYASQVLVSDGRQVVLLDLDEAAWGDPVIDLGNFLGHLERDALEGNITTDEKEMVRAFLLEGYGKLHALPNEDRLKAYTALGLFRLALDPFRFRHEDWPKEIQGILERTDDLVSRNSSGGPAHSAWREGNSKTSEDLLIRQALSLTEMQSYLGRHLPFDRLRLIAARMIRQKPGKRALIEYDLQIGSGNHVQNLTVLAKIRTRGLNLPVYRTLEKLYEGPFGPESADQTYIPQPLGAIPELHMYLQRKVSGIPYTAILASGKGLPLMQRVALLLQKLHSADMSIARMHGITEEMEILQDRLDRVSYQRPDLKHRLQDLLRACNELAESLDKPVMKGIHRDFYPDQIIVNNGALYLVDFDQYCMGDPALDAGNFNGHLTEMSLRMFEEPVHFGRCEEELQRRFHSGPYSVQGYALLTLARHIYLSTQFKDRTRFTEPLLELCEKRFAAAVHL